MSRIRSKNTQAELALRRELFRLGLRYRIHAPDLPGRPDIVFRGRRVAVFVDGDFWHGRRFDDWAHKLSEPWRAKIARNRARDAASNAALKALGWAVVRVWEKDLKADPAVGVARIRRLLRKIRSGTRVG
jgi:DNA mismatch endonuclease (patch repair protein)